MVELKDDRIRESTVNAGMRTEVFCNESTIHAALRERPGIQQDPKRIAILLIMRRVDRVLAATAVRLKAIVTFCTSRKLLR